MRQSMDWANICPLSFPLSFLFKRSVIYVGSLPNPHFSHIDKVKTSIANLALWLTIAAATKTSLLLLYYRLFSPSRRFSLAVYICAAIIICQWLSLTLANIFQCRPVSAFWNRKFPGEAECINLASFGIVTGVLNFSTDVLILCLPVPMVWGLNTTNAQKVSLTGIFLLGVL